jgi:Flp pilus assembly protein TadG
VTGSDEGTATIEFTFLSVLLLVPLVYVVLSASQVQRTAYAASEAARDAGRAYVRADTAEDGERQAYAAARLAFRDQGLELDADAVRITCSADPCLTPGARVTVSIRTQAALPGVPAIGRAAASIAVSAQHVEVVDAFREAPQ